MATITAKKSFEAVRTSGESIRSGAEQRFPEAASPGDTFRQGDIYIERLSGVNYCEKAKPEAQLAPGTTQGSRHVLDSVEGVTFYTRRNATVLDGPVLLVEAERTVTHPEHGDVVLPPGVYGITYQRAWADELRRVAD